MRIIRISSLVRVLATLLAACTGHAPDPTVARTATPGSASPPSPTAHPLHCAPGDPCTYALAACPHPQAWNEARCRYPIVNGVDQLGSCEVMCAVGEERECTAAARCMGANGGAHWMPFRGGDVPGHLAGECTIACDAW